MIELINLLKTTIRNNNTIINKYNKYNNIIENIKVDYNNLIELDLSIIKDNDLYKNIEVIRRLLLYNKYYNTTYKLNNNQLNYINKLIDYLTSINKDISKYKDLNIKYNNILSNINNNLYIEDIDTLNNLFDSNNLKYNSRSNILFSIMKHNLLVKNN